MPHLSACTIQKIVHRTVESSAALRSICVSVVAIALTGCGSGVGLLAPSATGGAPAVQPSAVAASPELGYLWSTPERTLRPILGVPGSSQLGAPLLSSGDALAAAASAASSSALIEQSNGTIVAVHLPNGAPVPVSSGITGDLKLHFAPQGLYAIAFVPGGSAISLISGLPDTPQLQAIPLALPGLVDAAVGDNGQLLVATASGSSTTIASLAASGHLLTLTTVGRLGGLAMVPGQDSAVIVDGTTGSALLAANISTALNLQTVPSTGVHGAVGLGVSRDGHWAVVANSADPSVVRLDLTGGAPVKIPCGFQPNQVSPLLGNAVFQLTDLAPGNAASIASGTPTASSAAGTVNAGPVWIIDASPATPQTLFIPAIQLATHAAHSSATQPSAVAATAPTSTIPTATAANGAQR